MRASSRVARCAAQRPVVLADAAGHPRRARSRPLPGVPLLPDQRVAALLPAGAAPVHAGTPARSSGSGADSHQARAVRHRRAGPFAGFLVAVPALFDRTVAVERRAAPAGLHRISNWASRCCSGGRVAGLGSRARTATRSTCTRWPSRRGSGCWPRRSTCSRSGSSTAGTSPTPRSDAESIWVTRRDGRRRRRRSASTRLSGSCGRSLAVALLVGVRVAAPADLGRRRPLDRGAPVARARGAPDPLALLHAVADRAARADPAASSAPSANARREPPAGGRSRASAPPEPSCRLSEYRQRIDVDRDAPAQIGPAGNGALDGFRIVTRKAGAPSRRTGPDARPSAGSAGPAPGRAPTIPLRSRRALDTRRRDRAPHPWRSRGSVPGR